MRIGCFVQGATDADVVEGLRRRWCPDAEVVNALFRGQSGESLRRELQRQLRVLRDAKRCDLVVILTDADENRWLDVKRNESKRIPDDFKHMVVFGVANRNIECWLRLDRQALAEALDCMAAELDVDDPSGLVKSLWARKWPDWNERRKNVAQFVAAVSFREWLQDDSFEDFYKDARALAQQRGCSVQNEYGS